MARPLKSGLDYFPLDISFDDSVELLEAEFGLEGFAVLIKIWQKIYANGYYISWNDDTTLLFSKKINTEKDKVISIINACLHRDLFNKNMCEQFKILTSSGIQKRYITACVSSKRKSIAMEERYLLIDDKYKKLITELTPLIKEETQLNTEESTQRKGKERKGNREESNKTAIEIAIDDFKEFRKKIKKPMTDRAVELLILNLNKLASNDETKITILNQSIVNGWQGVFPLKDDKPQQQSSNIFMEIGKERGYFDK